MKVPILSLQGEGLGFADAFGEAFEETGFAILVDHGITVSEIHEMYLANKQLFSHSDVELACYRDPSAQGQFGFFPFQTERARDQPPEKADLKRFVHIFRPGEYPNIWPNQHVPDYQGIMEHMFRRLDPLAYRLLRALDTYLDHQEDELYNMAKGGRTLFRSLHYPAVTENPGNAVRSSSHTDINLITLLIAATASGLKVMNRKGEWFPVNEVPGSIVVNVGDMLQMFTARRSDRRLISTVHAVDNDDLSRERFSAPFFVHPRAECVLDEETGYTARQFLDYRLVEIGLKPGDLTQMVRPPI